MTFAIRIATPDDAALLSHLGAELFEQTFGTANSAENMAAYLARTFRPEVQSGELGDAEGRVWIAEDGGGKAIGYAMLWRDSRTDSVTAAQPAEIQRIYADRSVHGRGVGDALMR